MMLDVVAFPKDPNPYQELLYEEMRSRGVGVGYLGGATRSRTLNLLLLPIELIVRRLRGSTVVHLHWMFGFLFTRPVPRKWSRLWFMLVLRVMRGLRFRVVWTAHNVLPHERIFDDDLSARRALVEGCDLVIAHSARTLSELGALGLTPRRGVVIPHGPMARPDLSNLAPPKLTGARKILFFGRIAGYKGVEELLEAVRAVEVPLRVAIAGACTDESLASRLRKRASDLPNVDLAIGFASDDELMRRFAEADAVIYPFRSITTSGSVMLGLASGRPLILPDLPALEVVPESAAIRYTPGVDGLRGALEAVATLPAEELYRRGIAARAAAHVKSWHEIAEMTWEVMQSGCREGPDDAAATAALSSVPTTKGKCAEPSETTPSAVPNPASAALADPPGVNSARAGSLQPRTLEGLGVAEVTADRLGSTPFPAVLSLGLPDVVRSVGQSPEVAAREGAAPSKKGHLGRVAALLRRDSFTLSSGLLVVDYLTIGAIGGVCTVIAARGWSPRDVGAVAALTGVVTLLSTLTSTGLASAVTRFLGKERNQLGFALESVLLTTVAGLGVAAAVSFVPGHFGVGLHSVFEGPFLAFGLIGAWIISTNVVAVTDPAFVSREEAVFAVGKDVAAAVIRVGVLVLLIGTGASGLFVASVVYVGVAAVMDLGLVFWRLCDDGGRPPVFQLRAVRRRLRFVVGSHLATVIAVLPATLLPAIVAASLGARSAAYVGVPLAVAAYVTTIPLMTSQAMLVELSGAAPDVARIGLKGLRLGYAGALPAAALLVAFAPQILLIFGRRYSLHSTEFLRWDAAASVFVTFNYIADNVLLGRQRVVAYGVVNAVGSCLVLAAVLFGVHVGFQWIGPGLFAGQFLYTIVSLATLSCYPEARAALRRWWRAQRRRVRRPTPE